VKRLNFWGFALLGAIYPATAWAEPPSDLDRAKESFRAGATAYAAGDYLAAIQALDAAYQLTPLPAIAFSLGQAERRQYFVDRGSAHLLRAISLFQRYVELAPTGSRRADALEALSQLEPLAAMLPKPQASAPGSSSASPEPSRRTRVLITAEAPGARLLLDGTPAVASPLIREVEPGKHRVEVRAPGFYATEREVTAVSGELILSQITLRERASAVAVWTSPDAEIYVDGEFLSAGGDGVMLQLASGKHRIAVAQKGYRVAVRDVTIERGKSQSIRIGLEPTPQRLASEALFIGGGAALGASLVFSALTIRAEDSAEDFLGKATINGVPAKHATGNVSSSELVRYDSALIDRDRYRLGTIVCLTGAAGFFITGLFLHELDQPDLRLLYRGAAHPGTDAVPLASDKPKPHIQVAPVVLGAGFGAMVGGVF
jgi:tetratricopeptide (TPR) repeat protein